MPGRFIEQPEQRHALFIVDCGYCIGVPYVVNPRHMLVADAFDTMAAEAELIERRALQRLGGDNLRMGMAYSQAVAGANRTCAASGRNVSRQAVARFQVGKDLFDHPAGHVIVPSGIAEFLELIEDHALGAGTANLPALVVDFLHIRFATGRGNHLGADLLEPLKPLATHLFGENSDRRAT